MVQSIEEKLALSGIMMHRGTIVQDFRGGKNEAHPCRWSLVTFSADGTTTVADQGNVNLADGTVFSAGHGSWIAQGERTFSWTTIELVSDLSGNLIGTLKVRGTHTVDESGNAYTGSFKADLTIFGNVLSFEGTNEGTRIQVEL